ncbi:hypothetical protein F2Q69_00026692, partial [Brassica cretica]
FGLSCVCFAGPTLTGILPYAGLKFYIYEELKRHVEEHQNSVRMHLPCGALAGLFGQTLTYPLDDVRRQMQVENLLPMTGDGSNKRYKNTFDGLNTIVRTQGWRQLFAGLSINYIKIVPSVAIGFAVYESMKSWLRIPPRERSKPTLTYPLDVVRRQMQVENLLPMTGDGSNKRYKNTIVRTQGWRQLFAGLSINYIKIVPSVAIGFAVYESMKSWLRIPPRERSKPA